MKQGTLHLLSADSTRRSAAKKYLAMESPAIASHLLARTARKSAAPSRCAPHLSASLDHCQLSEWLVPQVATLLVLASHLHTDQQMHIITWREQAQEGGGRWKEEAGVSRCL